MKQSLIIGGWVLLAMLVQSCRDNHFREGVVMAGGKYVTAETLNIGKSVYEENCMPCHGVDGKGQGVAAPGLSTPPRNFTLGVIKFGDTVAGELTHDEAIAHTLKKGLAGTAMLPWDLSDGQIDAVTQYIKTFAPDKWIGKDKELGKKIELSKDPYGLARKSSAIERGKDVYHAIAQCQSCHMAYVSHSELSQINQRINAESIQEFDPELYRAKPQDSDHGYATIPPDFTWDAVRSAENVGELYLRLASGVGGTAMPSWKGTLEDEDIWAVAYYVRDLMDLKNSPNRKAFMQKIKGE